MEMYEWDCKSLEKMVAIKFGQRNMDGFPPIPNGFCRQSLDVYL